MQLEKNLIFIFKISPYFPSDLLYFLIIDVIEMVQDSFLIESYRILAAAHGDLSDISTRLSTQPYSCAANYGWAIRTSHGQLHR